MSNELTGSRGTAGDSGQTDVEGEYSGSNGGEITSREGGGGGGKYRLGSQLVGEGRCPKGY